LRTLRAIGTEDPAIRVLAVLHNKEDHAALELMLARPKWIVHRDRSLASAKTKLRSRNSIPVVLCERDLSPDSWHEMLEYLRSLDDPPLLIVTSRLADERLWAEALNLGAYDVLVQPFEASEVTRILSLACWRWHDGHARTACRN
jgi:DNA-binding response OmpR family regulator